MLPRTTAVLAEHQSSGEHTGSLLSVSVSGQVIQSCQGEMGQGVPMDQNAVIPWLSAGKPITAVGVAQLCHDQHLRFDDHIVRWIPDFAVHGKKPITLRHVLTHTGGFGSMFDLDGGAESYEHAVRQVCASRLKRGWIPGHRAAYQARSGWQVLGEVIRVISGLAPQDYVAEHVLKPAGMAQSWLWADAVTLTDAGKTLAPLFDTSRADPSTESVGATYCSPGAGACGTVDDLRRFYEMMLNGGRGPTGGSVLPVPMATALTERHRVGLMDESFRHVMDWGLGFILDSSHYGVETLPYGYGRYRSPRTFGHGGSQCCTGFADPEHGLAVALAVNGRPGEEAHNIRFRRALSALYEDLELIQPLN